jgi:carbonic anhydrase/acetyltransferase-like protein (isoleucine patch superfamily)
MIETTDRISEVLTLADVAKILHCSKAHVCKIVRGKVVGTPRIPSIAVGRRKIIRKEALVLWMSRCEDGSLGSTLQNGAGRRA